MNLPNSVAEIGERAFQSCASLDSVIIPYSITQISKYTFKGCCGLKSVTIPNLVKSIGFEAFEGCSDLAQIICLSEKPPYASEYTFNGVDYGNCKLFVPAGSKTKYSTANGWKNFLNIIEFEPPLIGDVTYDGQVDISDVNQTINVMLGKGTNSLADVTGDGVVDIADVNAIINAMLGKR